MHFEKFTTSLLNWFDQHGRKNLPWQHPRTPYRVWVSEIMLQQTQVKTVIPYFTAFMERFPDIKTLAAAEEDDVLAHWSGLGYYSRARNLHKAAQIIHAIHHDQFPEHVSELIQLPGIGESTAAAIVSQAFNKPAAILDGNVKRVLSRYFLISGNPDSAKVKQGLWTIASQCMHETRCADYTQAIMDMGATCCTSRNPDCQNCPLQSNCQAWAQNVVREYPNKKPKKVLPIRHQQFLLLHDNNRRIYLERRPPSGLWGGLWCLPEINMDVCPKDHVLSQLNFSTDNMLELSKIKHTFSHFHLHIKPIAMQGQLIRHVLSEPTGQWYKQEELKSLGLAKPTSVIIEQFWAQQ